MSAAKKKVFHVGDKVFAKVRGYPAWPARVEEHLSGTGANAKFRVFFYGTYESATVKRDDLWPFDDDSKEKFGEKNHLSPNANVILILLYAMLYREAAPEEKRLRRGHVRD